ncbi:hypothetical protein [Lichenicoccus sp.]|uniref:hypothetical protein n=1 Tax=Lichenicoccus sp. TaxID=2781899 RepID=UPI003D121BC0
MQGDAGIARGTRRVVMTYLIAHGMAESAVMSGHLNRAGLVQLIRSDHAALVAIQAQASNPSGTALTHADGAVRALIDNATRLDTKTPPAGQRKAALDGAAATA